MLLLISSKLHQFAKHCNVLVCCFLKNFLTFELINFIQLLTFELINIIRLLREHHFFLFIPSKFFLFKLKLFPWYLIKIKISSYLLKNFLVTNSKSNVIMTSKLGFLTQKSRTPSNMFIFKLKNFLSVWTRKFYIGSNKNGTTYNHCSYVSLKWSREFQYITSFKLSMIKLYCYFLTFFTSINVILLVC